MNMKSRRKTITIEIVFSILISLFVWQVPEQEFDVPRLLWLNLAIVIVQIYIAYLRDIKINDYKAWIFIILAAGILATIWKFRGINAENYGDQYSLVIKLYYVNISLFIGLIIDLMRHKPVHIKCVVKSPLTWIYLGFAIIGVYFENSDILPLIIPMVALIFTDIERDKFSELIDCFGAGYYLVFFTLFTFSLIKEPKNYLVGRYLGIFANLSTTGVHAGIAVLICLYFFVRWLWSTHNIKKLIILILLSVYPIVVSAIVDCRSVILGLAGAIISSAVFLHRKNKEETIKRIVIAVIVCIIGFVGLFGLGYALVFLVNKGIISNLPYGLGHVATLGVDYEDGYFNSQILNKINAWTSQRLIDWVELIKQAGLKGIDAENLYTHNVYIFYIIKYGYIGGGLVIVWAITYAVSAMVCSIRKDPVFIMPVLYSVFGLLTEIGMNGYWMLPLGFYWVFLSYPVIRYFYKE